MLDHALLFGFGADHETRGVVEKQQRRLALVAQLDELRGLARTVGGDRAVVADETAGAALDFQLAANGLLIELALELEKVRLIGDPRDDFAYVVGLFCIVRDQPQQFVDGVERFVVWRLRQPGQLFIPRQHAHDFSHLTDAVGIVLGQIFSGTGDLRVHFGATEFFIGGDFAGRRLEQRWASEKQLGLAAHHHDVIRQPRLIGAARRGRAVHHSDLRQTHCRHARLIGEAARAFDKNLRRVIEIGTAAFGEGDHRQFVFPGDLLQAQGFFQAARRDRAALDRAVVGDHHRANSADVTDAGNQPATGRTAVLVVMQLVAGEAGQFEERRAGVEQQVQALAGQQLPAFAEFVFGFGGLVQQVLFKLLHLLDGGVHGGAVARERFAVRIELRLNLRHGLFLVLEHVR